MAPTSRYLALSQKTVGQLRAALQHVPDHVPLLTHIQRLTDDGDLLHSGLHPIVDVEVHEGETDHDFVVVVWRDEWE